jgi:hypothetical protein
MSSLFRNETVYETYCFSFGVRGNLIRVTRVAFRSCRGVIGSAEERFWWQLAGDDTHRQLSGKSAHSPISKLEGQLTGWAMPEEALRVGNGPEKDRHIFVLPP